MIVTQTNPPTNDLTNAANSLHLKEEKHVAFHRLAVWHLRRGVDQALAPGSQVHLDASTLTFLRKYGLIIWPALAVTRAHLVTSSTVTTGRERGLMYAQACGLVRMSLKAWKDAHDGREPDEDEQLLGSPIGKLMRRYFESLVLFDTERLFEHDRRLNDDQALLRDIITAPDADSRASA